MADEDAFVARCDGVEVPLTPHVTMDSLSPVLRMEIIAGLVR